MIGTVGNFSRMAATTCGVREAAETFKILARKHLASHNLDAAEYREKWGLKKDTPLVCKGLQRERRKKMKDMKLWEKRRKVEE